MRRTLLLLTALLTFMDVALMFVNRKSVSHELARAGMAWWYPKYAPNDRELDILETEARAAARGLWSQPEPVAPWKWRAERRRPRK